jgi:uncharacterized protein YdaU (DUF1376 family)
LKTDAWMPLWIGSYLADTQHLTRDEHGGYLLLLMAYWRNCGPLQDDDKRLGAIVKASPKEWQAIRPVLAEFFTVADGVWSHKRVEQELAGSLVHKEKAVRKAQAAAQARWGKAASKPSSNAPSDATSNAPSIPQALHEQCPTPSPLPSSSLRSEEMGGEPPKPPAPPKAPKPATDEGAADFEAAWAEYPTRPGNNKKAARKAWDARLKDGSTVRQMADGLRRYAAYCEAQKTEPRFIKQASTFFGPDRHFDSDWTAAPRQESIPSMPMSFRERDAAAARAEVDRLTGRSRPAFDGREVIDITPREFLELPNA